MWKRACAAGVVVVATFGCGRVPPADSPVFLVDELDAATSPTSSARVVLSDETRFSLTPSVGEAIGFDVRVPETPVLRFAIAVSELPEAGHWPPIDFRVFIEHEGARVFEVRTLAGRPS